MTKLNNPSLHSKFSRITDSAFKQTQDARPQFQAMFDSSERIRKTITDRENSIEVMMTELTKRFSDSRG